MARIGKGSAAIGRPSQGGWQFVGPDSPWARRNPEVLWLYIRAGNGQASAQRAARMRRYSWTIREQMADQELGENLEKNSEDGISVSVRRRWSRDDQDEWPHAVQWIKEQYERLQAVLSDSPNEAEAPIAISSDLQATDA